MFKSFKHGAALAASALLASAGTAQAAQFITNGTFSSPVVGASGYSNTQTVPGWQDLAEAAPYYVEVGNVATYGLPCIDGTCTNAEVNNTTFGDLVQTVSGLIVNQTYTFSFDYGDRNTGGFQALDVTVNGQTLYDSNSYPSNAQGPGEGLGWLPGVYTFEATSSTATVEFKAVDTTELGGTLLNPGGNSTDPNFSASDGNEITNVSLTGPAVPEPATWAMMLAGFAMIGAALRRRSTAVRVSFG